MNNTRFCLKSGVVAMAIAMTTIGAVSAHATETWKFQINVNSGDEQYRIAQEWADDVAAKTNGEINIELLPSSSIVNNNETLDAVGAGILQGQITDPSYFAGKTQPLLFLAIWWAPGPTLTSSLAICVMPEVKIATTA